MADPVVRVEPVRAVVETGGQVQVRVSVRNTNQIVEGFRLTVHGVAADWAEVLAAEDAGPEDRGVLSVYPGQESTATVVFTGPPASAGRAGEVPFCVLAQSVVDPSCSAAAEGDLEVGRVDGLSASLNPVTSAGRWNGRHAVRISNWGNSPAVLRLSASDPDDNLGFYLYPPRVELPVGGTAVAALRVRARHPFLRGTKVRRPFRLVAEPEAGHVAAVAGPDISDPRRPVLDGALDQRPVLSKLTVVLGLVGVLAVIAAVVIAVTANPAPAAEAHLDTTVGAPENLKVTPVDQATVKVSWDAFSREPNAVNIFRIDPDSKGQDPPVTKEQLEAPGSVTTIPVEKLEPDTEVCFQVSTVRGKRQSVRSGAQCARTLQTPAAAESATGTPTPTGDAGGAGGTGSAGGASGSGSTAAGESGATGGSGAAGSSGATGSSGAAGSSGASASPSAAQQLPDFGDSWVLGVPIPADPSSEVIVTLTLDRLRKAVSDAGLTLQVGRLDGTKYPALKFTRPTTFVYVTPFSSDDDARAQCGALGFDATACHPWQPGAPS